MDRKTLWVWAIAFVCVACNENAIPKTLPAETKKTDSAALKRDFLAQGEAFFDNGKLKAAIQRLRFSDREIMKYARTHNDMGLRAKLIGAVFSEKEFNHEPAKEQFWAAYRFNLSRFVETVSIVREDQKTFMDIGSGNGEKLYGALCLGFEKAYGLEYSEKSYKTSLEHLKDFKNEIEITLGDALEISPSYFEKADFMYMYSPIKDKVLMAKLFKRVMENMKDGAILLEVRCVYGEELRKQTPYLFPTIFSWLAVKRVGDTYYYKNVIDAATSYQSADHREWEELKKQ